MSKSSEKLNVAIIQRPPAFLNLQASVVLAKQCIKEAAQNQAQLVVFSETWLPGYPVWLDYAPGSGLWGNCAAEKLFAHLYSHSPTVDGPEIKAISQIARECRIDVVIGIHEKIGNSLYNSMVMLGADGSFGVRRKLMPTHSERLIWGQGDGSTLGVWQRPYGVVGGLICWEHWMPLARAAMHVQHEAIHIAQWPAVDEIHQIASRHYAFEGQCHVIAAGCVLTKQDVLAGFDSAGGDREARELLVTISDDLTYLKNGGSAVIAPDMGYLLQPVYDSTDTLYAAIALGEADRGKLYLDTAGHYARPDVFELRVNTSANLGVTWHEGDKMAD